MGAKISLVDAVKFSMLVWSELVLMTITPKSSHEQIFLELSL